MSRRNVLVPGKPHYACELCGEEIRHDVVRVDGGRIYHMSCFSKHVNGGRRELNECPACQTLGALSSGTIPGGMNATCAGGQAT